MKKLPVQLWGKTEHNDWSWRALSWGYPSQQQQGSGTPRSMNFGHVLDTVLHE